MKHHLKKATTETKHSSHSLDQTSSCPDHYITHYPTYLKLSLFLSLLPTFSLVLPILLFFCSSSIFERWGVMGIRFITREKQKSLKRVGIVLNACSCRNVLTNNNYHSILTSLAFLTAFKKLTPFNAMFPPIWKPSHLKL